MADMFARDVFDVEFFGVVSSQQETVAAADKNGDRIVLVKFYGEGDYYRNGLQKNYKSLCDMSEVCNSMVDVLRNLRPGGFLNEETYNAIMLVYKPFIEKHRSYEAFVDFLEGRLW
ncbi:hypothetical protein D1872_52000 [compost metagenome]